MIDWRNASNYPRADASRLSFAWEFLRRNPGYIAAWQRFVEMGQPEDHVVDGAGIVYAPGSELDVDVADGNELLRSGKVELVDEKTSKPADLGNSGRRILPIDRLMARPWGLECLVDPINAGPPFWSQSASDIRMPQPDDDCLTPAGRALTGLFPLIFDLSMPLEPQLASVAEFLRGMAEDWRRDNPERAPKTSRVGRDGARFVEMLRILDADAAEASERDISLALWPDNKSRRYIPHYKRLSDRRESAKQYRDVKYRELALTDVLRVSDN